MKFDVMLRGSSLHIATERAKAVEQQGYDCLWTVESAHNPFIPVVLGTSATTRLEFGTDIAVAFARSPFSMAQAAWDLQDLSHGRFHLGLGTQVRPHVERRFSMPFEHPAERVTDYIRCVRAIWQTYQYDTRPEYDGPFYRFTLMNPMFDAGPIAYKPPLIYLAGVNPRMCRAAGEVADGFHVHPMHSAAYLREVVLPALGEGARERNLRATDLSLHVPVFVASADEQTELDRQLLEIRRQIAFYGSTPGYRRVLEFHGLSELGPRLSTHMRAGEVDAMTALIPDALLDEIAIVATPAELGARVAARYDGLADRVSLYFGEPQSFTTADRERMFTAVRGA